MADAISNSEDIIDSREVIARIEELEAERDAMDDPDSDWPGTDESEELATLTALAEEAEDYAPDWKYGATLIRESYFTEYVEEMLKDCGELPRELPSYIAIDWERTADNVRVDYTEVDFDGVAYLVR